MSRKFIGFIVVLVCVAILFAICTEDEADAHPGGLHTWAKFRAHHLEQTFGDRAIEDAHSLRLLPDVMKDIRQKWKRFDSRYWASLEPAPTVVADTSTTESSSGFAAPPASGDIWYQLALCESGANPNTNTGNGFYGAFQFMASTWNNFRPGLPTDYSYAEQLAVAKQLQAQSGWGQWPHCAASLGLL